MPVPILYEDAEFLVLDKPAGLAVHPGAKTPHSLEDHLDALRLGFQRRPQPAHRLDRDTSGCLLLARNPRALKQVQRLFADGAIEKTYIALVAGSVDTDEGLIDAPLAKTSTRESGWRMVVRDGGKPAQTRWRLLERRGDRSLVEFRPATGRTHQIRVHAAHALAPIVGDPVYGRGDTAMRLHAQALAFAWKQGRRIAAEAPLPSGFLA